MRGPEAAEVKAGTDEAFEHAMRVFHDGRPSIVRAVRHLTQEGHSEHPGTRNSEREAIRETICAYIEAAS